MNIEDQYLVSPEVLYFLDKLLQYNHKDHSTSRETLSNNIKSYARWTQERDCVDSPKLTECNVCISLRQMLRLPLPIPISLWVSACKYGHKGAIPA